jgi:hypothetical protein
MWSIWSLLVVVRAVLTEVAAAVLVDCLQDFLV